jgi:16S rRNA (cytosine967-C5)-methyltransferase
MFVEAYLNTAEALITSYELQQPLHLYLKSFFKENKKFGSRDRRYISELVYAYYRIGKQHTALSLRETMIHAAYLKSSLPRLFFDKVNSTLAQTFEKPMNEKYQFCLEQHCLEMAIPYALSTSLTKWEYQEHLFSEPRVFIRVRRNLSSLEQILKTNEISYKQENANCLSFPSQVKLDNILPPEDYVIQDMASQAVGYHFKPKARETWWDCCTASGGKSIMLLDLQPNLNLIVSDVRESILKNLHLRFQRYNYQSKYISYCLDLTRPVESLADNNVDQIICDVPCSGSGTWSRSPEQFYFFSAEKLEDYHERQVKIAHEAFSKLKPGGTMYYITCSSFIRENEDVVQTFLPEYSSIECSELIRFPGKGADCLFISLIKKK